MKEIRTEIEIDAPVNEVWSILTDFIFEVEPAGKNATRFIQREKFNGILVGIFRKSLDTDIKNGFIAMNEALKKEAEKGGRQS